MMNRQVASQDDDLEMRELFKDSGVDLDQVEQTVRDEQKADSTKKVVTQISDVLSGTNDLPATGTAEKFGKGAIVGLQDVVRNVYNGVVDLSNYAEDFAASKGYGKGDLITEASKMKDPYEGKVLDTETEIARRTIQYATPLLGGVVTSGVKAGLVLEAAYSFFAIDPDEARVADALRGTGVEEIPILDDVVDFLQTKPDDTQIESRLKNLAEGMGFAGAVVGMVKGASKVYSSITKAKSAKMIEKAVNEKAGVVNDVTPAAKGAEVIPEENLDLFEKEWNTLAWDQPPVAIKVDESPKVNMSNDSIVDAFSNMAKTTDNIDKIRGPISDAETFAAVEELKSNPDVLEKLAKWTPDQGALTDQELLTVKYVLNKADDEVKVSATIAADSPSPDNQVKFARDFENLIRIKQIEQGISSEGGRVLRANQILGTVTELGDKEAMKQLGSQGRKKMYDSIIKKYGGPEAVAKNITNVKLIDDVARVANIPDESFTTKMDEVALLSTMDKIDDAVTKVALNGMLSNPKTWSRAFVGNLLMTSKNLVDNYVSVGIGFGREMFGGQGAMSFAEANARFKAALVGTVKGIEPAAKSFGSMKSPLYGTAKFDTTAIRSLPSVEESGIKEGFRWVNDSGIVVNTLTAGQLPRRVLVSLDTYFSQINFDSNLAGELVSLQAQGKFVSPEDTQKFLSAPQKVAPDAYLRSRANAGVATFSNPQVKGTLGYALTNGLDKFMDYAGLPFKNVVQPFLNTTVNIARATEEMTPLGLFRPFIKRGSLYRELQKGGRDADMAIAKMASGTSAIIATMMLLDNDDLVAGPSVSKEDWGMEKSFPPGQDIPQGPAVRVGEKYYSLRGLEPFSTVIDTAARLKQMSGFVDESEYADAATAFGLLLQDAFKPDEYTQGLSTIMEVITGQTDVPKGIANIASRFVPLSGAMSAAKDLTDSNKRVTKVMSDSEAGVIESLQELGQIMTNRVQARAPIFSQGLAMQRNYFGRAVKIPDGLGPDLISPIASSDGRSLELKRTLEKIIDFTDKYAGKGPYIEDFNVNMPGRTISIPVQLADGVGKITPYQMSDEEYSDFLVARNGLDPMTGELLPGRPDTLENIYYETLKQYGMFEIKPKDLYKYDRQEFAKMMSILKKAETTYTEGAQQWLKSEYSDGSIKNSVEIKANNWKNFELPGEQ